MGQTWPFFTTHRWFREDFEFALTPGMPYRDLAGEYWQAKDTFEELKAKATLIVEMAEERARKFAMETADLEEKVRKQEEEAEVLKAKVLRAEVAAERGEGEIRSWSSRRTSGSVWQRR